MPHHTVDARAMVMTDLLKLGRAYWMYASEPQTVRLAGKNPETVESNSTTGGWWQKTEDGELEFCSEPSVHYGGWYWESGRFVYKQAAQEK